jgi:hypothetical protein
MNFPFFSVGQHRSSSETSRNSRPLPKPQSWRRADEKKPADRIRAFGKTGYSPKERGRMKLPIIVL